MGRILGFIDNGMAPVLHDYYQSRGYTNILRLHDYDREMQNLGLIEQDIYLTTLRCTYLRQKLSQMVGTDKIIITGLQTPAEIDVILQNPNDVVFKITQNTDNQPDIFDNSFYCFPEVVLGTQSMITPLLDSLTHAVFAV